MVAKFRKYEFFLENMIIMQGSVLEMGQTRAIDICLKMDLPLNREDPHIVDLHNPFGKSVR